MISNWFSSIWRGLGTFVVAVSLTALGIHAQQSSKLGSPTYQVRKVEVQPNVTLEVLDWGGTGRPLVFLAGLGLDAHEFEAFAPTFSSRYHVFAISRRGFGASSAPIPDEKNYSAERLGDDVLAVLYSLKIVRPVLVGHSMGGEELSSIGSRFPDRVAGLIYLEAGYPYALYSPVVGDMVLDAKEVSQQLDLLFAAALQTPADFVHAEASVAQLDSDLKALNHKMASQPAPHPRPANASPPPPIMLAIVNGSQKFTNIHLPVLAIFAASHEPGETTLTQADAFQAAIPQARVVKIENADHFIFRSNEKQVIREWMRSWKALLVSANFYEVSSAFVTVSGSSISRQLLIAGRAG